MNIIRAMSAIGSQILNFIKQQFALLGRAFRQPMATSIRSMRGLIISLLVGLFVAIIAVGLEPFGLDLFVHEQKTLLLLGFGVVATFVMLIVKFILPVTFPVFYNKQRWTIARQSLHFLIMMFLLVSMLVVYSNAFHIVSYSIADVLRVFALSIIPVIATTFVQQKVFHNKFVTCAETINNALKQSGVAETKGIPPVLILGEKLSLLPNQFIYAKLSKASAEVYWQNFLGIEKTTVPADIEKALTATQQFIYLDRNIIANVHGIQCVEGNARGYQVKIARTGTEVAVPWKFHRQLERLAHRSRVF